MPLDPIFVSHGAPDLLITPSPAHAALRALGLPAATRAVVVVSAHWETAPVRVQAAAQPETIHDFGGFGPELARARYDAPGDPALAAGIVARLGAAGIVAEADPVRGRDHGAWVPLALMRPEADLPVLQVSLPQEDVAALALGRALAPLARDGIQLIASGSMTHSLRAALSAPEDAPAHPRAVPFRDWASRALPDGPAEALLDWRQAPEAAFNHPTPEHFRPLILARALADGPGERLHRSWSRGALAMDIWRFAA